MHKEIKIEQNREAQIAEKPGKKMFLHFSKIYKKKPFNFKISSKLLIFSTLHIYKKILLTNFK